MSGLGPKSNGIVEPIQLKHQRGTNEFGYEPASKKDHQGKNRQSVCGHGWRRGRDKSQQIDHS
ncbi:hypothetical protein H5410_056179 [Solanum commersonii]|uniref:Uncharacterized protein n=1 Tax=Solanum commersonii TaxID=4109 RepID=A0A9J5WKY0_SOLCO|nr:hypothetical protein H5410_056179 [Solanum commersonii]